MLFCLFLLYYLFGISSNVRHLIDMKEVSLSDSLDNQYKMNSGEYFNGNMTPDDIVKITYDS